MNHCRRVHSSFMLLSLSLQPPSKLLLLPASAGAVAALAAAAARALVAAQQAGLSRVEVKKAPLVSENRGWRSAKPQEETLV